jgi:anti-sigma factor RsiW
MQHIEEGTIHGWLDGALSPEEAAQVEAHVAGCPQCANAVAEARGFIAASSRILTALDNAPRGVVPTATALKRSSQMMWRAAAAVLVVAVGGLVVSKGVRYNERVTPVVLDKTSSLGKVIAAEGRATAAAPPAIALSKPAPERAPEATFSGKKGSREKSPLSATAGEPVSQNVMGALSAYAAADAVAKPASLKVVSKDQRIGETRTIYEVSPGDTATLIERTPVLLNDVAVTGVSELRAPQAAAGKSTASTKAAARPMIGSASDTQRMAVAAPTALRGVAGGAPAQQPGMLNRLNTITWSEGGKSLTLSGRLTVAQLEEVKRRIERERRAAAAQKNP